MKQTFSEAAHPNINGIAIYSGNHPDSILKEETQRLNRLGQSFHEKDKTKTISFRKAFDNFWVRSSILDI